MAAATIPGLERYQALVEQELQQALEGQQPLYCLMRYHLGWADAQGHPYQGGGKVLRSALCLWACRALEGPWLRALPAAAAVELIHNFSLAHDDVQDGDVERRHRPTLWYLWGRRRALATGSALWALAYRLLSRLEERSFPETTVLAAHRAIGDGVLAMIEGQCLDISYEGLLEISVGAYLDMVGKKTGALLGCALELGALLAADGEGTVRSDGPSRGDLGDPQEVRGAFRRCGQLLGLAFQARDDLLGIWGDEERTGKPRASDIRRRKKSLPVVYALEETRGGQRCALQEIYRRDSLSKSDVAEVLAILDQVGALPFCQEITARHARQALQELAGIPLAPEALAELEEVVAFLLEREF